MRTKLLWISRILVLLLLWRSPFFFHVRLCVVWLRDRIAESTFVCLYTKPQHVYAHKKKENTTNENETPNVRRSSERDSRSSETKQNTHQMNSLTQQQQQNSNSYVIYFSNHIMFVSMVYLVLFGRRHLLWLNAVSLAAYSIPSRFSDTWAKSPAIIFFNDCWRYRSHRFAFVFVIHFRSRVCFACFRSAVFFTSAKMLM